MAQIVPSFDGLDFTNSDGDCTFTVTAGGVAPILQSVHFDKNDGDYVIAHGYSNRDWIGTGLIFQDTQADMCDYIATLEAYEDDWNGTTWRTLVDTTGNTWENARILSVVASPIRAAGDYFYVSLTITGKFDGSPIMSGS